MLTTEQRRNEIISLLHTKEQVRVAELAERYGVSNVSIRKDLEHLEMQGHLTRVHGGAVGMSKLYVNMDLAERYKTNAAAKKQLAKAVATLIEDNDTIMMNAGTTLSYVLHALQGKRNITLVTNSLQNAMEASLYPSFNVKLLGGEYDAKYQFTFGEDAIAQLDNYHATKCILSVDGFSASAGLTLYYSNEVAIARKMISRADTLIVAADGTKLGKTTFARITGAVEADILVTGKGGDRSEMEQISALGIRIMET
ncbi:MAG: DeoR/GlpR transcriptional regulator [Clostridia bacterium]|nr:DeoR/GlpR transcriptional regulator [Clostridia bacterium]MBQ8339100.1 DeoR/GlpR transcriptional regulator [Clostridia bacterium]